MELRNRFAESAVLVWLRFQVLVVWWRRSLSFVVFRFDGVEDGYGFSDLVLDPLLCVILVSLPAGRFCYIPAALVLSSFFVFGDLVW
jgi:hypothetical protein